MAADMGNRDVLEQLRAGFTHTRYTMHVTRMHRGAKLSMLTGFSL